MNESHFIQRLYFPYYIEKKDCQFLPISNTIDFTPIKYDPPINPINDDVPEMFIWWKSVHEKGDRYGF